MSTNATKPSTRRGGAVDGLRHLEEVGTGAERLARAREHDRADRVVGERVVQCLRCGVVQRLVERVRGVGSVEGDEAGAVVVFGQQHGGQPTASIKRHELDRVVADRLPLVVGAALHDGFAGADHDGSGVGERQLELSRHDDVDVDGGGGVPSGVAGVVSGW